MTLLSMPEAARRLGYHPNAVRRALQAQGIPLFKRGRQWFVDEAHLTVATRVEPGQHVSNDRGDAVMVLFKGVAVFTFTGYGDPFAEGGSLAGFDREAVSGDDYDSPRAKALYQAIGVDPEDEEYVLGELPDGRWALVGPQVAGHRFAMEVGARKTGASQ